jgi:hypothetical protein
MKNLFLALIVFFAFLSCKLTDQKNESESEVPVSKGIVEGVDKDEYGCLASAGYTWSKINKECVKIFSGIQLLPFNQPDTEDEAMCAYVLFSEDGNLAEVFLPTQTKTIVLSRKTKNEPWLLDDWKLIFTKDYVLKKGEQSMFKGDAEVGNKITGSDQEGN